LDWLNYHHLYYFWVIAHQGSIVKACEVLRLAQPTLSAQLKALEDRVGQPMFERRQRRLYLTATGRTVLSYADRIFRLGQEMMDTVAERPSGGTRQLHLGVVDAVPKALSFALVRMVLNEQPLARVTIHEGRLERMLSEMHDHRLDLILSDVAASNDSARPARSLLLKRMPVGLVCSSAWRHLRREFPQSLNDVPMALPTLDSPLRHEVDRWLREQHISARILAECQDAEVLRHFVCEGLGVAPINLGVVDALVDSGELMQLGTALAQEQLWLVMSAGRDPSPLMDWIWTGLEQGTHTFLDGR